MATYDNKIWLLKNIRDAFIATDDTGLCEIVMAGEDFSKVFQNKAIEEKKRIRELRLTQPGPSKGKDGMGDISEEEVGREIVTQFDPYPDMDDSEDDDPLCGSYVRYEEFGGHRQRSNTAQWLDKKEQALKKAAKIKVIKWEDSSPLTTDQLVEVFSKFEVKKPDKQKSLLSEQLQNCPNLPHRQYLEYAKFDGTAQLGLPIKTFKIFMTMLPEKHQNYPLVVCVIASAKIKDLIGFTCYKYSIEHPDISLGSVHDYGLCIAEDDGEVDWAFPCLDANEPCSKFGFTCLGLVELKSKNAMTLPPSSIPEDGMSGAFHVFSKVTDSGQSHHNPSRHNTGGSSTSEAVLIALKALNEGSDETDRGKMQSHIMATEAPQYKAYKVQLLRKVRTNTSVQLGISLDRIEVEPLVTHKHAFWVEFVPKPNRGTPTSHSLLAATPRVYIKTGGAKGEGQPPPAVTKHRLSCEPQHAEVSMGAYLLLRKSDGVALPTAPETMQKQLYCIESRSKYFLHSIDSVAWCQILETRGNRTIFRIVYSPSHNAAYGDRSSAGNSTMFHSNTTYKLHDFECEHDMAKEIVEKVNTILDLRNSPCRREYKTAKEKKLQTRRSFHTKHLS